MLHIKAAATCWSYSGVSWRAAGPTQTVYKELCSPALNCRLVKMCLFAWFPVIKLFYIHYYMQDKVEMKTKVRNQKKSSVASNNMFVEAYTAFIHSSRLSFMHLYVFTLLHKK